ncbi:retrovirus-related Pol polyprotein from transposon opus [Trichonephila clavipes]|nr:retrovirus-related Pol polyprotein from transposon opus [Trichonephila clavipes]
MARFDKRENKNICCKEPLPAPGNRSNERRYKEKYLARTEEKGRNGGERESGGGRGKRELLEVITAERLETEQQQKLEQQEQLSIEKLRLEIELSRNANQSATQNNGQTSRVKSLDEIVKMVRLLTVKVPNKSDGWDYFFSSLEKAFASEMVSDELKPKVLLCMLGDKVSNLLVNLGEEELKDYESLKQVVLKEYEPSPQKYV